MAFELHQEICEHIGCKSLTLSDTSGLYSVDNPTGYGTPNTFDIYGGEIWFFPPNLELVTDPLVYLKYTFVCDLTGAITSVTRKNVDGTTNDVTTDFTGLYFPPLAKDIDPPFAPYDFTAIQLGYANGLLPDGTWDIEYTIRTSIGAFSTSSRELFTCQTKCCVEKMLLGINPDDCDCGDKDILKAFKANTYLRAAIFSNDIGNDDNAAKNLKQANILCADCDCGCS